MFVTGGIERALDRARSVARDSDVTVMSGAKVGKQYIAAGLNDEISTHLVPVLCHSEARIFQHLEGERVQLEPARVIETACAINLRFRIVR